MLLDSVALAHAGTLTVAPPTLAAGVRVEAAGNPEARGGARFHTGFFLLLAGALFILLGVMGAVGYRLNLSPSMPRGIWRVIAVPAAAYQRGQVVAVCPPVDAPFLPRGSCPLGMAPFVKQLVGMPGDVVTVTPAGVSVNGGPFLPHSAPLAQASNGQLLPQRLGAWRLTGYWLYGANSPRSFDSRYFGDVEAAALQGIVKPVVIFSYGKKER